MLNDSVKRGSKHLISAEEIKRLVPGVKIMTYPELFRYQNLDQVLPVGGKIALLYVNDIRGGSTVGHWTGLMRRGKTVEAYDSYNMEPDEQFKAIDRAATNQPNNQLSKLLLDFNDRGGRVEYNEDQHQSRDPSQQTCGRHVAIRLMFSDVPLKIYQEQMDRIKKAGLTVDDFSVWLTEQLLSNY